MERKPYCGNWAKTAICRNIIDPNKTYFKDWYYSLAADFLGVPGKDYTLRIYGTATFTYSAKEGIVYE